ncbi:MAG: S-layer homology domain-containing protein [Anaerolineales bacterium]|uniref:choice-of-anchor Q domain-containing protein n=1 Tax=Candidatus Villigracilis proximus TaxID=3140683 RepID=UPI0031372B3F|nr:S-layer homology domain-containing protein [Anaerolineales bacterium]
MGSTCTNIILTNPLLGILGDNGGFTQTVPLLAGSSAINTGNDAYCPATDQRGVTRANCDIGAYEFNKQSGPVFVVNTNGDANGSCDAYVAGASDCTLREAINAANTISGTDTITFDAALVTDPITLSSQLPPVTTAIVITGNGAANTIIQANGAANTATYRVFEVSSGNLTLDSLTIRHGRCNGSCPALYQNVGGGILNNGTLTVTNSTLSGNSSTLGGGGISNYGTLTVTNSTLSGNSATSGGGIGGGILNGGTLTVTNSTLSGNSSAFDGGGITNGFDGTLMVTNSTLSGNSATQTAGGISNYGTRLTVTNSTLSGNSAPNGGGIYNQGPLNFANTIIANSTTGVDCINSGGAIGTNTNNLVEDGSCFPTQSGDPALGPLADNGGPTKTFALLTGSPAIDAGDDTTCTATPVNNQSQNGLTRPQGVHCDIGAYELDNIAPAVSSIVRASANPTNASSVDFTVSFSETVTGVDISDFTLTTTGVSSPALSGISGTGSSYTVNVNTGSGSGTIRLNVLDDDTIKDTAGNSLSAGFTSGETYTISKAATVATFSDVPLTYWASSYIERLYNAGITGGCGAGIYCPDNSVTRAQMAVFLLKGIHGSSYAPPAVNGNTGFSDVAADYWAAAWIKQLAAEGITSGCGAGIYCPDATVTRAQMAVFLLKAKNGSSYSPPAVGVSTGFNDVATDAFAAAFIKQLVAYGITSGCGNSNYCPDDSVTRAQMAVFLVKAFGLP